MTEADLLAPTDGSRTGTRSSHDRQLRTGRLLATVLVYGLFAVTPLLSWWGKFPLSSERVLIFSFVALCIIGAALGTYNGLRPLILVASVFLYCWIAVPASYQIAYTTAAWQDPTVTSQLAASERALLVCVCAQLFLILGYLAGGRSARRTRQDQDHLNGERPVLSERELSLHRRGSTCLLVVAVALLPVIVSIVGGLGALFATRSELNDTIAAAGYTAANTGIFTLVKLLPGQLCIVAALMCIFALRSGPKLSSPQVHALRFKLFAAMILLLVYANPLTHTRFIFLAAFGSVALMLVRSRGWRTAMTTLLLCLVAFLFAYPAASYFRAGEARQLSLVESFSTSDFDGFQQVINTVTLVEGRGHADGHHVASALLFFVPRSVWTEKAIPASFEVAEARGYVFLDLSLPLPAELYLDLGWGGLAIVTFAGGVAWRRLDGAWQRQSAGAMLASYLAIAQIGLIRGPLGSLIPVYGIVTLLLLLLHLRSRSLARKPSDTPST